MAKKREMRNAQDTVLFIKNELGAEVYFSIMQEYVRQQGNQKEREARNKLRFIESELPDVYENLMTAYRQREATNGEH